MNFQSIVPKKERSPTPPLTITPKTSGVKLIAPIPTKCQKTSANWLKARKEWAKEEIRQLNALGLTVTRHFIRNDGMVLDWESPVPVWLDSLKPVELPISDVTHNPLESDSQVVGTWSREPTMPQDDNLELEACALEDMAIDFLKRYAEAFDSDRASLASSYAEESLFSYNVHDSSGVPRDSVAAAFMRPTAAYRFAPLKGSRNLLETQIRKTLFRGPTEIIPILESFGSHKFCSSSPTNLDWNVLALRIGKAPEFKPCIFLSSNGFLTERKGASEYRISFDQCFVLRKREPADPESASSALWPLVAMNHHLTIRGLPLRPPNC